MPKTPVLGNMSSVTKLLHKGRLVRKYAWHPTGLGIDQVVHHVGVLGAMIHSGELIV